VVVGRGADVNNDVGAGETQRLGGAFGVPEVFADRHAHAGAGDCKHGQGVALVEVALLVEDAVVGQELLVVDALHGAICNDSSGVVEVDVAVDEADDAGDALEPLGDALEGAQVVFDEPGAHEEVFRRVPGDRQLGERDDIGAQLAGAVAVLEDLLDVAIEVADGGVDLGEGDP
jgi:hypothetical protein